MANISLLYRLVNGEMRPVDISVNTLLMNVAKIGGVAGTDLTKTILDNLVTLQNGSDFATGTNSHTHDGRYYTEAELASFVGVSGSDLIGDDDTYTNFTPTTTTVKGALAGIDSAFASISFDAIAPTTTKGDLIVHNGTTNVREPVGTNTWVLTADSAQASGIKWAAVSGFTSPTTDSSFGNSVFNPGMTGTGNTAIGPRSLDSATTGGNNTAIGPDALTALTDGTDNVMLGYGAAPLITSGSANVGVGSGVFAALTLGNDNISIGAFSSTALTTGNTNVVVGKDAFQSAIASDNAVAIGTSALGVAVGAGVSNTVAIGASALANLTTGADNVAIGYQSLNGLTTGNFNTAVGLQSLLALQTGGDNSAFGAYTLSTVTTGIANSSFGSQSSSSLTSGSENTVVGYSALGSTTTGSKNVVVGSEAALNSNQSEMVAIGHHSMVSASASGISGATAVGFETLTAFSGVQNTAIGYKSGKLIDIGARNTGLGYLSLTAVTSGSDNTGLGNDAGKAITTATNSTAVGSSALQALTTGSDNTAVGFKSMFSLSSGGSNVAIGRQAFNDLTSGSQNVAIGAFAQGFCLSSNSDVVAIGFESLKDAKSGAAQSVAVGSGTMFVLTTGTQNVAVGYQALRLVSSGGSNTAVGYRVMDALTTGSANSAFGTNAGGAITTGTNNVVVGDSAALTLTSGSQNILIGQGVEPSSASASNEAVIGSNSSPVSNFYWGANPRAAAVVVADTKTLTVGGSPTGTDQSAATLIFRIGGAKGTGTGMGGDVRIATAPADGTGSAQNAHVDRVYVKQDGRVGIGVDPNAFGALDVASTVGAFLPPRMTTTQRDALTPTNSMVIYNTTKSKLETYENGAWSRLVSTVTLVKITTYTAVDNDEIFANSTATGFTITLPATPQVGARVKIADYAGTWGTNNVIVARNGSNINGAAADFTLNVNDAWAEFIYVDATQGWRVIN